MPASTPRTSYSLRLPERLGTCVVFASPHSGRDYPADFLAQSVLDPRALRSSEDAFIDQLLDGIQEFGAPLLTAEVPRAFIDLNRAAEELDPAVIDGLRAGAHNPRVASGLGVIPRVVSGGRAIYAGKITLEEARMRIERCWIPYHLCLRRLIEQARTGFGRAILVDMHSMPHEAMDGVTARGYRRPEIVLGDRFGAAASSEIVDRIEAIFEGAGFATVRNTPFAGAYVTQTYGRPARGTHAIQIEIDRSLYMNEAQVRPNGNFRGFRRLLMGIAAEIAAIGQGELRLAAE